MQDQNVMKLVEQIFTYEIYLVKDNASKPLNIPIVAYRKI